MKQGQSNRLLRVLMVATGRHVRGGITTVVATYERCAFWQDHKCFWLQTHDDRSFGRKILAGLLAFITFPFVAGTRDIVHIHIAPGASIVRKSLFFFMAKAMRKKIVIQVHCDYERFFGYKGMLDWLANYMVKHTDAIVALTPTWDVAIRARTQSANVHIIGNPIRLRERTLNHTSGSGFPTATFMGLIKREKGVYDLLEAMAVVIQKVPSARLLIVGDGESHAAKSYAETLGIAEFVTFRRWVGEEEKTNIFNQTTVLCLPSHAEGLPMVILESLNYGIPVVASSVGGIPDVIVPGQTGFLVKIGDVVGLADAIVNLLTNPDLCHQLGTAGQEVIRSTYSDTEIGRRLSELYNSIK